MYTALTPNWDNLVFSIRTERLSINCPTQPLKYLKVMIKEHTTGNATIIPEYPCRYNHTPAIEELLKFLYQKTRTYLDVRYSGLSPSTFLMERYRLTDRQVAYQMYLFTKDCHNSLKQLLDATGVTFMELRQALGYDT
ncbi:MAG: hypothetical protein AAF731_04855 [Bacteroidota bacterium]